VTRPQYVAVVVFELNSKARDTGANMDGQHCRGCLTLPEIYWKFTKSPGNFLV